MIFTNRAEAGELLAKKLSQYKGAKNILVLGVPRGGVVVAKEVAKYLNAPLDIVVTRKIGHPLDPEYAIAAVDEKGKLTLGIENPEDYKEYLKDEKKKQMGEIKRRLEKYRGVARHPGMRNKVCIIVDDGLATGLTVFSALDFIKSHHPKKIILALPVVPLEMTEEVRKRVDGLDVLYEPEIFFAIGQYYEDFPQVSDEEVQLLLHK